MGFIHELLGVPTNEEFDDLVDRLSALSTDVAELRDLVGSTSPDFQDLTAESKVFVGDAVVDDAELWVFQFGGSYFFGFDVDSFGGHVGQLFIAPPPRTVELAGLVSVEGVRSTLTLEESVASGAEQTPAEAYWTRMPVGRPGIGFLVPKLDLNNVRPGEVGVVNGQNIPWNLNYGVRGKGSIALIP